MSSDILSLVAPLLSLIVIDLIVGLLAMLAVMLLAMWKRAAYAVLKRNFLGYFSNPTGYVFLCLFVLLTSMAAFWPDEFFNSNLANLDQLNYWLPVIMLFFIPAITMSIWAEEKRQGTDELLLTLPADDFDIVIGKYLSAAAIYTVSLVFSQISTFMVLLFLSSGEIDIGLFAANYLGYWFIGLAMLAIGMIASFLTSNLTVGFILGALFNAPLVFASASGVLLGRLQLSGVRLAETISMFSISEQFDSFGRGVISAAPAAFFLLVGAFGLYCCMVLIGRRHWSGGQDGNVTFLHYLGRLLLLVVIVFSVSYFLRNNDRVRYDATEGKVSSLSETTRRVIRDLSPEQPIVIEAFISNEIPEQYARTRYDLLSLLKEFQAQASSRKVQLQVQIYDGIETSSEVADRAEKQYGIVPENVRVREQGSIRDEEVLLGAAVRSGLSKVVIPFFETGIPVEYELVRSIDTVAQPTRRKLGIVQTDANFMGGFSMAGGMPTQIPRQPIVDELEKQYDVEQVDPSSPISTTAYDVLLVPQPSSLNPTQLPNVVAAIEAGVPTAIFEDPLPAVYQGVPGTAEPKQAQGGMFGGGQPPEPKGDMLPLWNALGIEIPQQPGMSGQIGPDIVWQKYNPHPKMEYLLQTNDMWLFTLDGENESEDYLTNDSLVTDGLRELMFLYAGAIKAQKARDDVEITNLVVTRGDVSGRAKFDEVLSSIQRGASKAELEFIQGPLLDQPQTIAVMVKGVTDSGDASKDGDKTSSSEDAESSGTEANADSSEGEAESGKDKRPIRAIYVADIDCLHPFFSEARKRPEQFAEVDLRVQNITFLLNAIDVLAGEESYPKIRSHEPRHATLRLFEEQAEEYRMVQSQQQKEFQEKYDAELQKAEKEGQEAVAKFQEQLRELRASGEVDAEKFQEIQGLAVLLAQKQGAQQRKLQIVREKLEQERDSEIKQIQRTTKRKIDGLESYYKMLAVIIPPIPPLLVGAWVFIARRVREREGIAKTRLR
ncbi:MAG TPA: ABC transporter permease [Planctomycetaceae bacterium]|nr:ABC transporter permease [Planctomycetaceae bacterium]